ncbi:MAG: hypothetical protein RBR87_08035 [Bacteroidales bacterium]|nr:hypothetical protein [Bacteroidales bacterium]
MKRQEKSKEMFSKVEAWKRSGLTMSEYAQSQRYTTSGFEYWVRKYRKQFKKDNAKFVQVFPSAKTNSDPIEQQAVKQSQGEIVFSFANGMTITINL